VELLTFVEDLHENGYAVWRKMIIARASKMLGTDSHFPLKSYAAQA
jgi:hypothetical protein